MASTYLTRAMGSVNEQQFTWSFWVKRGKLGVEQHLVGNFVNGGNRTHVFFDSTDTLRMYSELGNSVVIQYETNRKFRDVSAWYHIVIAINTTQAGGNRIRFYVNGEEETSFKQEIECNQNTNLSIRATHYIGTYGGYAGNASYTLDGSLSHLHFVDGTQLTPSTFGQYDANGVWKIKTDVSVTYGTNGFFILKDGNSVTDQSGNGNNFTASGTLTNTEDNPSNVFATLNVLAGYYNGSTFSNGNNTVQTGSSQYSYDVATLGASSGKFYWEVEYDARSGGNKYPIIGITSTQPTSTGDYLGKFANDWGYYMAVSASKLMNSGSETNYGSNFGEGDIIGVALDLDNNKLYFSLNGTWQNSGDPTSGSTGTGAISITDPSSTSLGAYFPAVSFYDGSVSGTFKANFGNGYFGTTAVASAGTNASGNGIFEYDVPTGYTALSTKGLNL